MYEADETLPKVGIPSPEITSSNLGIKSRRKKKEGNPGIDTTSWGWAGEDLSVKNDCCFYFSIFPTSEFLGDEREREERRVREICLGP
jgi:hypothetical protein